VAHFILFCWSALGNIFMLPMNAEPGQRVDPAFSICTSLRREQGWKIFDAKRTSVNLKDKWRNMQKTKK